MNKRNITDMPTSLHAVSGLQEVHVRGFVKLRPLAEADAGGLLAILDADSSIRTRVTVASRFHKVSDVYEEAADYRLNPGLIRYTILDRDKPVGLVSLWRDGGYFGTPAHPNVYGFGYFLDPSERGKGLVKAALQKLMEVVARHFTVSEFVAYSEDDNAPSVATLRKLGFKPTDQTLLEPTHGWSERKYVKAVSGR